MNFQIQFVHLNKRFIQYFIHYFNLINKQKLRYKKTFYKLINNIKFDNYQTYKKMFKQIVNICNKSILSLHKFTPLPLNFNFVSKFSFAQKKQQKNPLTAKFTQIGSTTTQQEVVANGRSWFPYELRIKSTQDLHKLWYVCVRQKNILLADKILLQKNNSKNTTKFRLLKLKKTMSRILTVINERAQIRKQYRQKLEKQYIEKKRSELQKQVSAQPQPLPEITWELLRSKYQQLRRGIDNIDYLQKIWQHKQANLQRKKRGQIRTKQLQASGQRFQSYWQKQMSYEQRPTQQQILRAHVTNWKSLNLKQRKIILGFLNAKRSKDAKNTLTKQLKILGQKLAHQQIKERTQAKQTK